MLVKLILSRKNEFLNRTRAFSVFIDGEEVGKISNDKVESYDLVAGKHTVLCKIDWCSSMEYKFEAKEDDTVCLQVKSGMKYFMPLYLVLLVWLASGLIFKNKREVLGAAFPWIQWILVLVPVLYMGYYFTLGRNKFLHIARDKDNVFAK